MEGSGGQLGSGAPQVGLVADPPGPMGPPTTELARDGRPGIGRRVAWWLLGPLLTALALVGSLWILVAPVVTYQRFAPTDLLAVNLTLVMATAALFRRRWPVWSTLVAGIAVIAFGARQYPLVFVVYAPCLCAAAAVYWCRARPAVEATAAAAVGLATASLLVEQRGFGLDAALIPLAISIAVAAAARLVRAYVVTRRRRWEDPFGGDEEPWYRAEAAAPPGWPATPAAWTAAGVGGLALVVVVNLVTVWALTTPPLSEPGDLVVLDTKEMPTITGAATASDGSIYSVAGIFAGGTPFDLGVTVRRYATTGELIWSHPVTATDDSLRTTAPRLGVALGATGDAKDDRVAVTWVVGDEGDGEAQDAGAFVEVVDGAGTLQWIDRFGPDWIVSRLSAPVALPDGGFAVAGTVSGALDAEAWLGQGDAFVRSYGADGTVRWTRQFGTAASDAAIEIGSDAAGNVYVVGGSGGELVSGGAGAFLTTFDPMGEVGWTRQFGTGPSDVAVAVAVDPSGATSVVWGSPEADSNETNRVTAFAADGTVSGQHDIDIAGASMDGATLVDGRLFVTGCRTRSILGAEVGDGRGLVVELVDGRVVAERELGSVGGACIWTAAPGPDGGLLVGGSTDGDGAMGAFLVALQPALTDPAPPDSVAMDEADFYTGLVARLYSPLRSADPDPDAYAGFIAACGEPALELGCGDGDPMLELRARGLDVTGVDSSADMLERLRARADERGLDVVVHHQRMQDLDLGTTFRSIYLAGPTFALLPDDAAAAQTLRAIRAHLEPGGAALIPLFVPEPLPPAAIGHPSEHVADDGTRLAFRVLAEDVDEDAQRLVRTCRYESVAADGTTETVDRDWVLHWYTQAGFRQLAEAAGLHVAAVIRPDASPADPDDDVFVFWLTRPR